LLTGKHSREGDVPKGRFKNNENYLPRFYTDSNFEAVERIRKACDEAHVDMVTATYAWLLNHSALCEDDGVLLGASSLDQLDVCLEACSNIVDLPASVKDAFDGAWAVTRPGAFHYWRSYSADMPDRETRDPGAAYDAAKKK
jgi:aflatoxin B1 aldehyde reductase